MYRLFKRFFQKFRPPPVNVIVVGSDYPSYQLASRIQSDASLHLAFFMNEAPWQHRTFILGTELRYSSELIALVVKHNIKAVLCAEQQSFDDYQQRLADELALYHCQLLLCEDDRLPDIT